MSLDKAEYWSKIEESLKAIGEYCGAEPYTLEFSPSDVAVDAAVEAEKEGAGGRLYEYMSKHLEAFAKNLKRFHPNEPLPTAFLSAAPTRKIVVMIDKERGDRMQGKLYFRQGHIEIAYDPNCVYTYGASCWNSLGQYMDKALLTAEPVPADVLARCDPVKTPLDVAKEKDQAQLDEQLAALGTLCGGGAPFQIEFVGGDEAMDVAAAAAEPQVRYGLYKTAIYMVKSIVNNLKKKDMGDKVAAVVPTRTIALELNEDEGGSSIGVLKFRDGKLVVMYKAAAYNTYKCAGDSVGSDAQKALDAMPKPAVAETPAPATTPAAATPAAATPTPAARGGAARGRGAPMRGRGGPMRGGPMRGRGGPVRGRGGPMRGRGGPMRGRGGPVRGRGGPAGGGGGGRAMPVPVPRATPATPTPAAAAAPAAGAYGALTPELAKNLEKYGDELNQQLAELAKLLELPSVKLTFTPSPAEFDAKAKYSDNDLFEIAGKMIKTITYNLNRAADSPKVPRVCKALMKDNTINFVMVDDDDAEYAGSHGAVYFTEDGLFVEFKPEHFGTVSCVWNAVAQRINDNLVKWMEESSFGSSDGMETRIARAVFDFWKQKCSPSIDSNLATIGQVLDGGEPFKIEFQNGVDAFEFDAILGKEKPELRGELYRNLEVFMTDVQKNITGLNSADVLAAIPARTFVFEVKAASELPRRAMGGLQSTLIGGKCHLQGPVGYYFRGMCGHEDVCGDDDLGDVLRKLKGDDSLSARAQLQQDTHRVLAANFTSATPSGSGGGGALKPCKPCSGTGKMKCGKCHRKPPYCKNCKFTGNAKGSCSACRGKGRK